MSDTQDDIRLWMQAEMAKRGHGVKGELAKHLGIRPDAITRMANTDPDKETREIRAHELVKMREFFEQPFEAPSSGGSTVPIMGFLGAGAEVEPDYEQVPPDGLDTIEVPFPVPDEMVAFIVKGDSMLPVYKDGHVIVVYREQKKPLDSFYGEDAAVRTSDGRRFIKTLQRGQNGLVNLFSWNAKLIENVQLEWIGEIFATFPRSSLKKSIRQGGIQGQLRLKSA